MTSKNKKVELYLLGKDTCNPIFEGFGLEEAPSLLGREDIREDIEPGFNASEKSRIWKPDFLSNIWKAPKVVGRVAPFNDCPFISLIFPAFSERACDALRDLLVANGELLPLDSEIGNFFFYNVTRIVDALDVKNSVCHFWCDPPTTAVDIEYFQFHKEALNGQAIFRIYERPIATIVTDEFVDRVHKNGLNGFRFNKIWPLPKGVGWREFNKKLHPNKGKKLRQNTLVIIFYLKRKKPNSIEKKSIKQFEDELNAMLAVPSLNSPYFGKYEGSELTMGQFRLFISCPNADDLVRKLKPWLKKSPWDGKMEILKRMGEMHDVDVQEEKVIVS